MFFYFVAIILKVSMLWGKKVRWWQMIIAIAELFQDYKKSDLELGFY